MTNQFASSSKFNTSFIVKNIISDSNKTVKIFNYPIPVGKERDLLAIKGVSESDIRASLLKGEILIKIKAGEIAIMNSDIDLLQFNDAQKAFLKQAGVTYGTEITSKQLDQDLSDGLGSGGGSGGLTKSQHDKLRSLIHFIDDGPTSGFASGAVRVISPPGSVFPNAVTWFSDGTLNRKIVEKIITYDDNSQPLTVTWNMFDTDGATVIQTVIDTINYTNNIFESTRTRTIV